MEQNNQTDGFRYSYSAKEQKEIEAIRNKYVAPEETEDKMQTLRRLDASVTKKGTVVSLILGILGALLLGTGMSCAMTEIGNAFGNLAMPIGIALGLLGILLVCLAYPIYNRITKKERERIAPMILSLTDELMK